MNLGDGLKLETQILNGKPKLILAPYAIEPKISKQTGSKKKVQKHILTIKQTGQILKATQNAQIIEATQNGQILKPTQNSSVKTEKPLSKKRSESGLSETESQKNLGMLLSDRPINNSLRQLQDKDQDLIIQQDNQIGKPDSQKANISVKKTSPSTMLLKQKTQKKPKISAQALRESLVCLTQEQFQQILKTINQATKATEQVQDDTEKATVRIGSGNNAVTSKEESVDGLLKKASDASPVQDENNLPSEKQEVTIQTEERVDFKNMWQDGDLFSTLGERERDKTLLEAKKSQWRKELDDQVALKKKEKEGSLDQTKYGVWANSSPDNISSVKGQTTVQPKVAFSTNNNAEKDNLLKMGLGTDASGAAHTSSNGTSEKPSSFSSPDLPAAIRTAFVMGEAAPLDHPFSALKRQQQKKWIEELNKQREEDSIRKMQDKLKFSEVEDHDRWTMHFDSLKKTKDQQLPLNTALTEHVSNQPAIPEPQEPIDLNSGPEKSFDNSVEIQSPKTSFLRSMTALLDPVQIEERDRKRQKQLEHQKAIAAQVEEKRRRKQMEDELRQREEQDEEQRLAMERELIQKQFQDDVLKQKKKEEVLTLKTKELYQSVQRAQEEALKLKQEQRMRVAQKGHNIAKLQSNLGGNSLHQNYARTESCVSNLNTEEYYNESSGKIYQQLEMVISPGVDTAVQTDDFTLGTHTHSEAYIGEVVHRDDRECNSPDVSIEFKKLANSKKHKTDMKHPAKKNVSSKENNIFSNEAYDQFARTDSEMKRGQRYVKKPGWNTNKTGRRYVPASERYPRGLQKQREEKKVQRQMELLNLVERNASRNLHHKNYVSPQISPSPREDNKEKNPLSKDEHHPERDSNVRRSESPPVPAVKNKLHQLQQRHLTGSNPPVLNENGGKEKKIHTGWEESEVSPGNSESECERPPSSRFMPYVRTKEIYYLDPEAPMSRPSTHDPQYRRLNGGDHQPRHIFTSDNLRDPLLNPNVVKNKDRQQAILKGLSELRQGLLRKQKEMETCLLPDVN